MTPRDILVVATLDTKGAEAAYLRDRVAAQGARPVVLDTGILGTADGLAPDITRHEVARAAGFKPEGAAR
jgi:uncharacterized protein (UPF0261 family)